MGTCLPTGGAETVSKDHGTYRVTDGRGRWDHRPRATDRTERPGKADMGTQDDIVAEMIAPHLEQAAAAYLECALWAETCCIDQGDTDDRSWYDRGYELGSFAPSALADARATVTDALAMVARERPADVWPKVEADPGQFGHDLWLTRQHHGAGFWDGNWDASHNGPSIGRWLTDTVAKPYGETYTYMGTDGFIHFGDES